MFHWIRRQARKAALRPPRPASAEFLPSKFPDDVVVHLEKGDKQKTRAYNEMSKAMFCIAQDKLQDLNVRFAELNAQRDAIRKAMDESAERNKTLHRQVQEYKQGAKRFYDLVQNTIKKYPRHSTGSTASAQVEDDDDDTPVIHIVPPSPSISGSRLSSCGDASDYPSTPTESEFSHGASPRFALVFQDTLNQTVAWSEASSPTHSPSSDKVHLFSPRALTLFNKDSLKRDLDESSLSSSSPSLSPVDRLFRPRTVLHKHSFSVEITRDVELHYDSTVSVTRRSVPEDIKDGEATEAITPATVNDSHDSAIDIVLPAVEADDEGNDEETTSVSSGSSSELLEELSTSEIVRGTPTSSARAQEVFIPPHDLIDPIRPDDPFYRVDQALKNSGIDTRPFWPAMAAIHNSDETKLDRIRENLATFGQRSALGLLHHYALEEATMRPIPYPPVREQPQLHYTAELVSPSDPVVSPRIRYAGPPSPIVQAVSMLQQLLDRLDAQGEKEASVSRFGEEEVQGDDVSIYGEPFGPSRSNTLGTDEMQDAGNLPPPEYSRTVEEVFWKAPLYAPQPVHACFLTPIDLTPLDPTPSHQSRSPESYTSSRESYSPSIYAAVASAQIRYQNRLTPQVPSSASHLIYDEPMEMETTGHRILQPLPLPLPHDLHPRIIEPVPIVSTSLPHTWFGNSLGLWGMTNPVSRPNTSSELDYPLDGSRCRLQRLWD